MRTMQVMSIRGVYYGEIQNGPIFRTRSIVDISKFARLHKAEIIWIKTDESERK